MAARITRRFSIFDGYAHVLSCGVGTNGVPGNSASGSEQGTGYVSCRMTYDFVLGRKYRYEITRTRGDSGSDFRADIIDTTTNVSREIGTISIAGFHTIGHDVDETFVEHYGTGAGPCTSPPYFSGVVCPSYSHPITVDVQPAVLDGLASTVFTGLVNPVNALYAQNVCQNASATPFAGGLRLVADK
jgi:hypothetical protein